MEDVRKSEWKRVLELGFVPKNKVVHSVHKRHYYLSEYDYDRMNKFLNKRKESE